MTNASSFTFDVDPREYINLYGVDAIRYYMVHEMPFASDGTFTRDLLIDSINANLANVLGNLVNRTIGMINKYFDGIVENKNITEEVDNDLINLVLSSRDIVDDKMNNLRVADSLDAIFDIFRKCNKYIDETMPWVLAKDEKCLNRLSTVLYNLVESIRFGAVLLQAYMPDTSEKIFNQLNTNIKSFDSLDKFGYYKSGTKLNEAFVLFQRID